MLGKTLIDVQENARDAELLPVCAEGKSKGCLEKYHYPPTAEQLLNLEAAKPASTWKYLLGFALAGFGVFLWRKR